MKIVSLQRRLAAVCAGLFVCGQPVARAQVYHQWFKEKIAPPARESSVDDYLIELSKALPANCIMDATGIDAQARVKPFPTLISAVVAKWDTGRMHVIDDFRSQTPLAQQALGDYGTLLFWRGPNLAEEVEAARLSLERRTADEELLIEAKTEGEDEQTPRVAFYSSYKPLQERWAKYLREAQGWDGQSADVNITVKVADLPPDLRALTLAQVRYTAFGSIDSQVPIFSDEFWDTVRLVVDTSEKYPNSNRPIPYLGLWSPLLTIGDPSRLALRVGLMDEVRQPVPAAEPAPAAQTLAQATPGNTVPPAPLRWPDRFARMLFPSELETDTALQHKLSLEAKRRPLKDVVGDLKQRSGVSLALAPGAPFGGAPVTLRVSEMPLWKMMASLSRIYGATWSKDGDAYTLRSAKLDPLDAKLLRRGYAYHSLQHLTSVRELRDQQNNAVAREIVRHVRRDQLNSPQGAPLSDVPEELRDQVRKRFEAENAERILGNQSHLDATSLEGMVLRFAQLNIREPDKILLGYSASTGKNAQIGAFAADGRFLCVVFDRFRAKAPQPEPWDIPVPGFPPMPPGWQFGDPLPPAPPKWWKPGKPTYQFPPGWKKGDPWPEWPEPQAAPPAPEQAAPGGPQ